MYNKKNFFLVVSFLFSLQLATSQNNTNSPYTRFGYGDISETNSGENRAMGGVSIGSRSHFTINPVNPASYSVVDSMTFMFDLGSSVLGSHFSDGTGGKSTINSNLEYITMQFPINKWMGLSAGLLPYSFAGYNFYTNETTYSNEHDTIPFTKNFSGTGGFSQVYTGVSVNLFNHISLGINAYYMYGNINNYRNLNFGSASGFTSTTVINSLTASNFRFRFGSQFYNTFDKKHDVTLGVIFESKKRLNGSFSQIKTGVLDEIKLDSSAFELPTMFGVGLNYIYDKKLTIGMDYSLYQWKTAKFFGKYDDLNNRSKIAIGLEYMPNPLGRKYSDRIRYRTGFNMSNSYYKVAGGTLPSNYGITFGFGLPLRNSNTVVNASFEYGKIGSAYLLREDYFKFTFNAVFNEHWFFKRKL
jgi:hypothetical protein